MCLQNPLPGTLSVLKPATIALKIGHLAFQVVINGLNPYKWPKITGFHWGLSHASLELFHSTYT